MNVVEVGKGETTETMYETGIVNKEMRDTSWMRFTKNYIIKFKHLPLKYYETLKKVKDSLEVPGMKTNCKGLLQVSSTKLKLRLIKQSHSLSY